MTGTNGPVVTFGEAMVRLTPPHNERLERTTSLDLTVGGAELNSAVTLACLDVPATWVSRLPDTPFGRAIARGGRAAGVDLSHVQWVPESAGRAGVYYLEEASDPRPSAVYYDRAGSAFARMAPGTFNWAGILTGARALHISGITPALGPGPRAETMAAIRAANAASIPVGFDLNYRSKLWSESDARACFVEIVPLVDILFASRGMLRTFFNIDGDHAAVLEAARTRLGLAVTILSRKRGKASRSVRLGATAIGRDGQIVDGPWRDVEVVDRLGGGDAFAGGFIAGYLADHDDLPRALALASAAQALKHTMPGDFLCATRAEIEAAVTSDEAGVLQR
ncbi:MAG: PfkB family carbohydrate kinase [Thermomicrobiales bacterium]